MKKILVLFSLSFFIYSCDKAVDPPPVVIIKEKEISPSVAIKWAKMTTDFIKYQPANSPTYSSRGMGYMGLTMYESIVAGSVIYQSVAPSLNGLGALPKPIGKIDWELSLNEGQRTLITKIWESSTMPPINRLDSLHKAIVDERTLAVVDTAIINASRRYGKLIAQTIFEWSTKDNGHLGYYANFVANYTWPSGLQYWVAPFAGQVNTPYPLHPYWGKNRTFLRSNSEIPVPSILMYSTDKTTAYFKDFREVYDITKALTPEQKETAVWWSDDPSETAAPGGHSYSLARQILEIKKNNLFEATSIFAKVGMSIADAFICCWKTKYQYNSERPANYIRRNIDQKFVQFWPEPPFPAFVSGHATQIGASSVAMISVFGDNVSFMDNTYLGRAKNPLTNTPYTPRAFTKISDAAEECGLSRLYGGIHTRQDNTEGLKLGRLIGTNISNLQWRVSI